MGAGLRKTKSDHRVRSASESVSTLRRWQGGVPAGTETPRPLGPALVLGFSLMWLFLSCVLQNKSVNIRCFPELCEFSQ